MKEEKLMEAGRKLDALIAEKVMGWTRYSKKAHPTDNRTIDGVLYCPPDYPYECGSANVVPNFSTEIVAAWWVALNTNLFQSRIDSTGLDVGMCLRQNGEEWEIFYRHGVAIVRAATAPHAICLAALKATEATTQ